MYVSVAAFTGAAMGAAKIIFRLDLGKRGP
jgi:hypothetical protein